MPSKFTAPPLLLDPTILGEETDSTMSYLKRNVIGQDKAAEDIISAYQHIKAGLHEGGRPAGSFLLMGPTGVGKAQPLNSLILTTLGWQEMGDTIPGDFVITPENKTSEVLSVHPQGEKQIYKLTFADGRTAECCDEHLWNVFNRYCWGGKWRVLPLSEMREFLTSKKTGGLYIQLSGAVDFYTPASDALPMDPYALGSLLGNGCLQPHSVSFSDDDLENVANLSLALVNLDVDVSQTFSATGTYDYRVSSVPGTLVGISHNKALNVIRSLGLGGHGSLRKFVPMMYKEASASNRLSLVQGLMDTDGHTSRNGSCSFSTSSKELALDVQYLIRSLGGCAKITSKIPTYTYKGIKKVGALAYRVFIRIANPRTLFRSSHHLNRMPAEYQYSDCLRLKITNIEPVRMAQAQCLMIADPAHLYITNDFVVTHNTSMVESLATSLHGSPLMLKISCGEFSLEHEAAKMLGAPPGYLGHRETPAALSGPKLAACVTKDCQTPIILFDEIEKAASALVKILLNILDKGKVTLGDNTVVDFSKALVFFTSNLGSKELSRQHAPGMGLYAEPALSLDNAAVSAIRAGKKKFSPEFWNRLDKVIVFDHLKAPELARILELELMKLDARGQGRFVLNLSHAAKALILEQGTSLEFGARELKRTINALLTKPLSNLLVSDQIPQGREVIVDLGESGALEFSLGLEGPLVILAPSFLPDTFPFTSPLNQRKVSRIKPSQIGVN